MKPIRALFLWIFCISPFYKIIINCAHQNFAKKMYIYRSHQMRWKDMNIARYIIKLKLKQRDGKTRRYMQMASKF
jgi:hypothetical protein